MTADQGAGNGTNGTEAAVRIRDSKDKRHPPTRRHTDRLDGVHGTRGGLISGPLRPRRTRCSRRARELVSRARPFVRAP